MPVTPSFIVNFPEMDAASLAQDLSPEVLFCDPGIHVQPQPRTWRPNQLPMDLDTARAFLREARRFAQEHGTGRAALTTASLIQDDFYAQTSLAIRAKLTSGSDSSQRNDKTAVQIQQVILLAWQLEQENMELRSMHQDVEAGWARLTHTLGVDTADADEVQTFARETQGSVPAASLPWQKVVQALLFFTPPGVVLASCNREVAEALDDAEPTHPGLDLDGFSTELTALIHSGEARLLEIPGWRIAGKTRLPEDKPWLESKRVVLLYGQKRKSAPGAA